MLTITCEPQVSETNVAAQVETLPSDAEIMRRVKQIRSSWTPTERQERRLEAEQRFADLLDQLCVAEAA